MSDTKETKSFFPLDEKKFSILLFIIITIDAIITVKIGEETNPTILWVMEKFSLTLNEVMIWRMIWCSIFIYIIYKLKIARSATYAYLGLYAAFIFVQFFHYFTRV